DHQRDGAARPMKRPADIQQRLLRAWYEQRSWLVLLRPLSALYCRIAMRKRQRHLNDPSASWQPPVPLIVVGNVTLGGTGRTPMVIWLVEHLRSRGLRVGVNSSAYCGKLPLLPPTRAAYGGRERDPGRYRKDPHGDLAGGASAQPRSACRGDQQRVWRQAAVPAMVGSADQRYA